MSINALELQEPVDFYIDLRGTEPDRDAERWIAIEHDVAAKRAAAFTRRPLNASPTAALEIAATTV